MTRRTNFVAYAVLTGICLAVSLVRAARPDLFVNGPPSFDVFLSIRGTLVVALLGLIGVAFLERSGLRGLWDADLSAGQKLLFPFGVGVLIALVNITLRQFIPVDQAIADFMKSAGRGEIDPPLAGAILGYGSGGILVSIVYFLILIPPFVYLVSGKLLKGEKRDPSFWLIALPLALWEPLTNPPLSFSIERFGALGASCIVAGGFVLTFAQIWFMRRSGFVALVAVRLGLYTVTHMIYQRLV